MIPLLPLRNTEPPLKRDDCHAHAPNACVLLRMAEDAS